MEKILSKEQILDKLLPHEFYTPVYPKNSKPIHEDKCERCEQEDMIFEAMKLYAQQQQPAGLRWVNVATKNPSKEGYYYTSIMKNGVAEPSVNTFTLGLWEVNNEDEDVIFWLDEQAPSPLQEAGWIAVEDGLPEFTKDIQGNKATDDVLIFIDGNIYSAFLEAVRPDFTRMIWSPSVGDSCFDIEYHHSSTVEQNKVTHWQPLPAPPIPSK